MTTQQTVNITLSQLTDKHTLNYRLYSASLLRRHSSSERVISFRSLGKSTAALVVPDYHTYNSEQR